MTDVFPWRVVVDREGYRMTLAFFAFRQDADNYARSVRSLYVGGVVVEVNL